jgi:hypothetical protein
MKLCLNMMPVEDTFIIMLHHFVYSITTWQPHELMPLTLQYSNDVQQQIWAKHATPDNAMYL